MNDHFDVLILGGGMSGLGAALNLPPNSGLTHAIIDASDSLGGGARTLELGGCRFDLGVHGLIKSSPNARESYEQMLGFMDRDELISAEALSGIFYRNRMLRYPFSLREIFTAMAPQDLFRSFLSFLSKRIERHLTEIAPDLHPAENESYESWMIKCFGKALYDCFFAEYATKVWGVHPSKLRAAEVARRIKTPSLWASIINAVKYSLDIKDSSRYSQAPTKYVYCKDGCGRLPDIMTLQYLKQGGNIFLNTYVQNVEYRDKEWSIHIVDIKGKRHDFFAKYIVSSLPLTMLARAVRNRIALLDSDIDRLKFRTTIFVNLLLTKKRVFDKYQWVYFQEAKYPFMRVNEYSNISPSMCSAGKSIINAEIACFQGDDTWNTPDDLLINHTVEILTSLRVINKVEVIGSSVVRMPNTYPVFTIESAAIAASILEELKKIATCWSIGRCGRFSYINMDEGYQMGLEATRKIAELTGTYPAWSKK